MAKAPLVCVNCSGVFRCGYEGQECPWCGLPYAVLVLRPKKLKGRKKFNNAPDRRFAIGHVCGWTCYLCGGNVPMPGAVKENHPLAPSVDHVVPKSAGGKNAWANLRIAHRSCNNERGSKSLSREQALRARTVEVSG